MDRQEFWAACQRAPMFKEPGGADWQHPAAMSRGSMGKMGRSVKEFEILWLLCWWVHPAAAVLTKKTLFSTPSLSQCMLGKCSEWNRTTWSCVEVATKANAVAKFVSRVYVKLSLVALLICPENRLMLATQCTCLLVRTPHPVSSVFPYSDRWSKLPGTYSLYYASMLLQQVTDTVGCMLAPLQLLWNVKGEPTIAWCIH